jgi:hypothetical protein
VAELGAFASYFSNFRKSIAAVSDHSGKFKIFAVIAKEAAHFVSDGLPKPDAVDELYDIARAHGLPEDDINTAVADAFANEANRVRFSFDDEPQQPQTNEAPARKARAPHYGSNGQQQAPPLPLPKILSQKEFLAQWTPPDYLIKGLMQRGFVYALTGATGHAKTAVALLVAQLVGSSDHNTMLGKHRVKKGRVLYFVGENDQDVRTRVKGTVAERKSDGEDTDADNIWYIPGRFNIVEMMKVIEQDAKHNGPPALIIVDTSAAYFLEQEENSNTQIGTHARKLRGLTNLTGKPCVLVLCHPIKAAQDASQLLPRGGGAFIAEMDANLTLWKNTDDIAELAYTKLRGPSFEPILFRMRKFQHASLLDVDGDAQWTVQATVISTAEEERVMNRSTEEEDRVLCAMLKIPDGSMSDWAREIGWLLDNGEPYKSRVQRIVERLGRDKNRGKKMIDKDRKQWRLTEQGKKVAYTAGARLDRERVAAGQASLSL